MGWTLRVLRHRAAAQSTLLAAVLAVALVGATLLGTFALLFHTSETRALGMKLDRAPASATEIDAVLGVRDRALALPAADAYLDELLGDVEDDRTRWLTSALYHVGTGERLTLPMAYLASGPAIPEHATLRAGDWPAAAVDADGRIPVAIPTTAADAFGWTVGTVLPALSTWTHDTQELAVVGVHELDPPGSLWRRDLIDGAQLHPSWPIPGTYGFRTGPLYGPFVVVPAALESGPADLATARVVAAPDLAGASTQAVRDLRAALVDGQAGLAGKTAISAPSATLATFLPGTIDQAVGDLATTRVTLVVVGLMLVVLVVTVLLLAARLLAERRAAEQTLMAARGASTGQILRLAALETAAVAAVTALVTPWLARLAFDALTRTPVLAAAGMHHDPGTPLVLWVTCAVAAVLLAGVLLLPSLRRRSSVVEAEQRLVRQDRRGALARSGADVALLVLAGVAVWQLQGYRSPVAEPGTAARIDPVLVAAPALLLLAGAVLALRLLPLVAAVGERAAARSRSLVAPLGAWEIGRRPGRASGAVLLLTLAVAVASFAQSFLGTWRTSQVEQVDLAVGTDLRIDRVPGTPLEQSAAVAALTDAGARSPVADRTVSVGAVGSDSRKATSLVAVDTTRAGEILRGRSVEGWGALTASLAPTTPAGGVPLPGTVRSLLLDVTATATPPAACNLYLAVVVQDETGARTTVDVPGKVRLGTSVDDLRVDLPVAVERASVVGLIGRVLPLEDGTPVVGEPVDGTEVAQTILAVDVTDVRAVAPAADGSGTGTATSVPLGDATWSSSGRTIESVGGSREMSTTPVGDGIRIGGSVLLLDLTFGAGGFATTTFEPVATLPAVVSDTLANALRAQAGNTIVLDVGDGRGTAVKITRVVPYLPGHPRGPALLVDHDALTRATLTTSFADPMLDEWWVQVPDAAAAAVAADVERSDLGSPTSRVAVREEATDGPLRVGVQAALWIVALAALALAFTGFAMSATVSVRTRRLELARLQALGAARGGLVRAVLVEHTIIGVLGVAAGLAIGGLLAGVLGPLLTVSVDGRPPVPRALVRWEWPAQLLLVAALVALVAVAVTVTTNLLLRRASGTLLRLGDER